MIDDSLAKIFPDSIHSEEEAREIIIGRSLDSRIGFESSVRAKQPEWRRAIMKKLARVSATAPDKDLDSEYRFDYATAKPNRFAGRRRAQPVVVVLAPDVAKVFKDGESVNAVLRSIVKALPLKSVAE